jgi:DUF971 family protein
MSAAARTEPVDIRMLDGGKFEIEWADGETTRYLFRELRLDCRCAGCVNEVTGAKVVRAADVPADVHPLSAEPVGNYAIRFHWSDGHSTGLYTYEHLRG